MALTHVEIFVGSQGLPLLCGRQSQTETSAELLPRANFTLKSVKFSNVTFR